MPRSRSSQADPPPVRALVPVPFPGPSRSSAWCADAPPTGPPAPVFSRAREGSSQLPELRSLAQEGSRGASDGQLLQGPHDLFPGKAGTHLAAAQPRPPPAVALSGPNLPTLGEAAAGGAERLEPRSAAAQPREGQAVVTSLPSLEVPSPGRVAARRASAGPGFGRGSQEAGNGAKAVPHGGKLASCPGIVDPQAPPSAGLAQQRASAGGEEAAPARSRGLGRLASVLRSALKPLKALTRS
jgi:hypothetical protein